MRLLSCRWMYCALGVAAFFWCGRSSHAGVYSLEVIVDSLPFGGPGNTTFNGFNGFGNPSINNDGDVAFWATASGTGKGIYKYSATTNDVSTVVPYSTLQATDIIGLAHVEMNNAGNVVHAGKRTDLYSLGGLGIQIPIETHFIYVNDTMLVRTNNNIYAGTPIDGLLLSSVSSASINDSDVIAFAATGGFGSGVFTQFDKLAATGDIIDGHVINSVSLDVVPSIDNQGNVAFVANFDGSSQGVFLQNQLLMQSGDIIDGHVLDEFRNVRLTTSGQLVVLATTTANFQGIFTPANALIVTAPGTTIDGEPIISIRDNFNQVGLAYNDNGDLFFNADTTGTNSSGIFTLDDMLIHSGDIFQGYSIVGQNLFPDVNDDGVMVFAAKSLDPESFIIRATSVPEVSSGMLVLSGAIALFFWRMSRPRNLLLQP